VVYLGIAVVFFIATLICMTNNNWPDPLINRKAHLVYRPKLGSLTSNSFGKYGVPAVDQNGQIVDMIPGSE